MNGSGLSSLRSHVKRVIFVVCIGFWHSQSILASGSLEQVFSPLRESDAVLVTKINEHGATEVFSWQANKPLIPASLVKLATSENMVYLFQQTFIG